MTKKKLNPKKLLIGAAILLILLVAIGSGAVADRLFGFKPLDKLFPRKSAGFDQKILTEESVVIDVAEKVSPSVVTVSIQTPAKRVLQFSPFGGFSTQIQGGEPQDIGTGFVVSSDGLIITNKHVVAETGATYKVITQDNKEYKVAQINRDPANDVAILKIDASGLKPVELGDSSNLKVGQFVIAIGTAMGEFRHTVTTGVISGLGRGITAGSVFEGYVEELDNVIQTDAAINPGNSGGPLLNSAGQVIGVNVAIAQGANNIGFAIPISIVKDSLNQFKANGKFSAKAYLGVQYQMVSRQTAILNNLPQGAYVVEVVAGSPAEKAGVKVEDIITKIDGQELTDKNGGLAKVIAQKKPGDTISLDIYRDNETLKLSVTLSEFSQ
jgi:2-alkenal reductase